MATRLEIILLLIFLTSCVKSDFTLTLLHNNDIHGRFEQTSRNSGTCRNYSECVGGFGRMAHVVRSFRQSGEPVLFLNAGDTFVGTTWFSVYKWNISAEFLNLVKPDVMCLGNHEFDFGVPFLTSFINAADFPIIGGNLNFDQEPSLNLPKSVILTVEGKEVGIVGHLIPDTKFISQPGQVEFLDVIQSVRNETEKLKNDGIDIIIVLGHSGYEMDKKIAKEVSSVDIVVGGHTNTFLWNGEQPDSDTPEDGYPTVVVQSDGKKVPVVQAYAYTKYLGVLNVTFDDDGNIVTFKGQPIFLDTDVPQEEDVLQLLEKYRPGIDALETEVVGVSRVMLNATSNRCRYVECNLGNMIADAFVYYIAAQYSGPGWTDTPIGLINGGGVRTTINPPNSGNITRGDVLSTIPFDNQVLTLTLTGAQLIETLEIGVRGNGETSLGEFLQVSGLRVVYNMNQPSFSRVVSVKVRCGNCSVPIYEDVRNDGSYNLVTVSFLTDGGDDHHVLKNAENKKIQDLGDVDTVVWYLGRQSPVYPEEQGRIEFIGSSAAKMKFYGFFVLLLAVIVTVCR